MALVRRPKLLLLDEPTSGVSAEEKFVTMDRVIHAVAPDAATIVFVEHDMEIVSRYADRVVAFYQGRILADGDPHDVLKDAEVRRYVTGAALGIGYMPEDRGLVPQLTVEENILLPLWVTSHLDRKARLDFVYEVIGEVAEMRHRKALLLSGGQQKLVALGRALGIGTKCLLLDEPFEGIAPALAERLSEVLASLKRKDLTFLMSQSDMNHSHGLIDVEFTIERGANLAARQG